MCKSIKENETDWSWIDPDDGQNWISMLLLPASELASADNYCFSFKVCSLFHIFKIKQMKKYKSYTSLPHTFTVILFLFLNQYSQCQPEQGLLKLPLPLLSDQRLSICADHKSIDADQKVTKVMLKFKTLLSF